MMWTCTCSTDCPASNPSCTAMVMLVPLNALSTTGVTRCTHRNKSDTSSGERSANLLTTLLVEMSTSGQQLVKSEVSCTSLHCSTLEVTSCFAITHTNLPDLNTSGFHIKRLMNTLSSKIVQMGACI